MLTIGSRFRNAWNAFNDVEDHPEKEFYDIGPGYSSRPDRLRLSTGNERSLATTIYNQISIDVASIPFRHARVDEDSKYLGTIKSGLNNCLTLSGNIDQTGKSFIQDVVLSMFDEGCVAIVPVDTTNNPNTGSFDVISLRTAKIIQWYPYHVLVRLYNDRTGIQQEIKLRKNTVAIIENPLYAIMNSPNSTMTRLINKLNLLDVVDQSGSGKLDLIIQLPYVIKTEARRAQAEIRRKDIETQLANSKYGVAYTDATEHITQLNRAADNNLMTQIEFLTRMLYSQLGMSPAIFDGSADENGILAYYNRTIDPVATAISDSMNRVFITQTARTQGQAVVSIRDPFKFVPTGTMAEIADKFTRNEILTSNEIRSIMGFRPSSDPNADKLRNKNLNSEDANPEETPADEEKDAESKEGGL